ncbi:regulator of microtubule dynamics protein 1-like [Cloeon dipterum]|uniref:regulator of microtubule dynamics protein 1-like n=1 Tax=Cloeon dipterum TaxID=197152 RepID=UPI00321FEC5B
MILRHLRGAFAHVFRQYRSQVNAAKNIPALFSAFLGAGRNKNLLLWIPTVTTVHTFSWSRQQSNEPNIKALDELFDQNKFEEICQRLAPHKDGDNVEFLWRYARALYKRSKVAANETDKKNLVYEAFAVVERALQRGAKVSPVHKWYSILLDAKSHFEGTKARITVTEKVKEHMLKAVELDPKDSTTLYMLGLWCYEVTVLPWYQRKIASTIFAKPPDSSYEEALSFCERAEKISPNFYSLNLLLIGKIYDKLGQKDKAVEFLKRARDYIPLTDDDINATKEAKEILTSMGVKN